MSKNIKPFLKWAGGKTQLLDVILDEMSFDENIDCYIEPFLGAGAVFFRLIKENMFKRYIINDINTKLINLYFTIRDDKEALLDSLYVIQNRYVDLSQELQKEMFYDIREKFNKLEGNNVELSAYFIFLNKTCFNGLYRENSKGEFNVPIGSYKKNPIIYDREQIEEISNILNRRDENGDYIVTILNKSYDELESIIDDRKFVYLDPPYRPITKGGFSSYNKSGFNDDNQKELGGFFRRISEKGAKVLLSNSDPKNLDKNDNFFDELYKDFIIKRVLAKRNINSKGNARGNITEILVKNY